MNRRKFVGSLASGAAAAALGTASLELEGCDVWTEIQAWVPAGISAFEQIVTLVLPIAAPGINVIAQTVEAGFSALAAAVNQYINAPAASKATFKDKVLLIFSQLQGDIQAFLSAVNVDTGNPIVKIALGLVEIIVSTITGFLGQIGAVTPAPTFRLSGQSVTIAPVRRDRKRFVSAFNNQLVLAGHPELKIY
jgi:hypothetical protein